MGKAAAQKPRIYSTATTGDGSSRAMRFALAKFRPPALPATLITRSGLHDRLTAGAGQRLTVVVGSAGAGKSVLLADWAAARPPGVTSWLSCDKADVDPVRFWAGFVEAPRGYRTGLWRRCRRAAGHGPDDVG
jgi:LuxR family transcriptional regulator, maltose regulon positive regulatory protein